LSKSRRGRWMTTQDGRTRREVVLGLRRGTGAVYETAGLVRQEVARAVRRVNRRSSHSAIRVIQWEVRWRRSGPRHLYLYVDIDVDGPAGLIEFRPISTYVAVKQGEVSFTNPIVRGDAAIMVWNIRTMYNIRASARLEW